MKQSREENNNNGKKADKMHVKEWLHQNAKRPEVPHDDEAAPAEDNIGYDEPNP